MQATDTRTDISGRTAEAAAPLDPGKIEAFQGKILGDLAGWSATLLTALGDRLGLFKDMADRGPATSVELATRTGLAERYTREWLAAMACAGSLAYDPRSRRFSLPAEHALILAQEGGPLFLSAMVQLFRKFGANDEKVEQAFHTGGGVAQEECEPQIWAAMERESAYAVEHSLIEDWLPLMPAVQKRLEDGAAVADVGCGAGRALIKLAQTFPKSRLAGYDWYGPQLERAKASAAQAGVADRVRFELRDATQGLPEQYDLITTFDVIHDAVSPQRLLHAIREGLRPDGAYLAMEFNYSDKLEENIGPIGTMLYTGSLLYCTPVSLAGDGVALGTAGLPEPKFKELASEAGFGTFFRLPIADPLHALYELKP
jgi:SAM-dependent methyltransferase